MHKKESEELEYLRELLNKSKDLAELEKNYWIVKNSALYNSGKKIWYYNRQSYKERLDEQYEHYKSLKNSYDYKSEYKKTEKWKCPKCGYESYIKECRGKCWDEKQKEDEEYRSSDKLLWNSKTLPELENNYQKVKNSSIYSSNKDYKTKLDKYYERYKFMLTPAISSAEKEEKDNKRKNFTLEKVKDFFQERKIKRLNWESGKIKIVCVLRSDGACESLEVSDMDEDPQIQNLKQHLQENNKTSLTWEELFGTNDSFNRSESKPNKPKSNSSNPLVFLIIVVVVIILIIAICVLVVKKSKKRTKK